MNNIKELLEKRYETRRELDDLKSYYTNKLMDCPHLKYIYNTWIKRLDDEIQSNEIEIQYYESIVKV